MFARTDRLTLRRFTPADAERFAAYRSDPQVARFQSWEAPLPLADAQRTVERFAHGDPEALLRDDYLSRRPPTLVP